MQWLLIIKYELLSVAHFALSCIKPFHLQLVPARKPILSNATASDDETLEPASMTDSASSDQVSSTDSQSTSPDPIVWKNHYHNTPDQSCHQQAILR